MPADVQLLASERGVAELARCAPCLRVQPLTAGDPARRSWAWVGPDLYAAGRLDEAYRLLARIPHLEWVQGPGTGLDHPALEELRRHGVEVVPGPSSAGTVAQFVLRAALDHVQGARLWRRAAGAATWARHDIVDLADTAWLILGAGAIGQAVGELARACGAVVVFARRAAGEEALTLTEGLERIGGFDVIVACLPSTEETRGSVAFEDIERMRPGALLINVGRGDLFAADALRRVVASSLDVRLALDVVTPEPLPGESPLWRDPRIDITPHNAGARSGRLARAADAFAARVRQRAAGASPGGVS